jgi:dethiobiotin synthetase
MPEKHAFFLTGTDTDVGKTFIGCALLMGWKASGLSALGIKPVAAGVVTTAHGQCNADAVALMEYSDDVGLAYEHINPVLYKQAIAPHIAAARYNREISVCDLLAACEPAMQTTVDRLLVEGAGGWLVPLNAEESMADLAQAMGFEVLMVVRMRLGCLNHAMLTQESIYARGLRMAGWIACAHESMPYLQENIDTLKRSLKAPCLGVVPPLEKATPELALAHLDNLPGP